MKNILLFVGGFIFGGVVGAFGSMKYFKNKYQKQYEKDYTALEEYYHRADEYARSDREEEKFENEENSSAETNSSSGGRMSQEERKAIKEKLNKNWAGTTNYAKMYKMKDVEQKDTSIYDQMVQPVEMEYPCERYECAHYVQETGCCGLERESDNSDEECGYFIKMDEITPEEEAFDEHQKNKHRDPKIISEDTFSELPAYIDQKVLYLYADDEVLVDEDNEDEPIDEPERLIGDALTKYGFIDNDEDIIYVMNYEQDTCYEIQKIDASWSDSH